MKMRIIVTGGAGFIGSHVVDAYIRAGHRVAIIDNLTTGFRRNINPRAKFYKADVCDTKQIARIFSLEKPEVVNHHAALISVIESVRSPLLTLNVNVLGTANILQAFGKSGRGKNKRFIYASSGGAIYGDPKKLPADEKTAPLPLSPYAVSKLMAEEFETFCGRTQKFSYVILRYANVYGPRQNPEGEGGVVAIFAGLMRRGKQPIIFGDGTKTRDYVYVGDVAQANILSLKKGVGGIFNIGLGAAISDQKIFDAVAKYMNFMESPVYGPFREGEVYHIRLNAARAKKILGWRPKIELEEGIRRTIASL